MNEREILVVRAYAASEAARQSGYYYTSRVLFELAMKLEAIPADEVTIVDQKELLVSSE